MSREKDIQMVRAVTESKHILKKETFRGTWSLTLQNETKFYLRLGISTSINQRYNYCYRANNS